MQGAPTFVTFIWLVQKRLAITEEAEAPNRAARRGEWSFSSDGKMACLCRFPWPPALCFFLYWDLKKNLPQELRRDFLPALMAIPDLF